MHILSSSQLLSLEHGNSIKMEHFLAVSLSEHHVITEQGVFSRNN